MLVLVSTISNSFVSVAQLDARDQEVAGSTPAGSATFFCRDLKYFLEIFSMVILSLSLIQEGQLPVSGERMCTILVNLFED